MEKNKTDGEVKAFLEQYFQDHPNEKTASNSPEVQLYRWRVVETCLYAGIAMEKIDHLRELLERGGTALTGSQHLKAFVPKIEEFELARLRKELEGQRVCVIFDGTTRLGECITVLLRWCPAGFKKIEQRLVALRTTKTHMNGDDLELGALINTIIGTTCRVQTTNVVCGARDSCSTNGKAFAIDAQPRANVHKHGSYPLHLSHALALRRARRPADSGGVHDAMARPGATSSIGSLNLEGPAWRRNEGLLAHPLVLSGGVEQ
eukprot:1128575-Prymnesium_polylepis.2